MTGQRPVDESSGGDGAVDRAVNRTMVRRKAMRLWDDRRGFQVRARVVAQGLFAIVGLLVALCPEQALARAKARGKRPGRDDKRACAESYYKAKESIQSGRLLDVKEPLGRCARAVCGSFLKQECTKLYLQMDTDVPSVVPAVPDAAAGATFEVRMDGELLTSKLDGLAIPVNPGWHEFTFSTEERVFATQKILIAQGERNRAVTALQRSTDRKIADAAEVIPTRAPRRKAVALEETDSESEKVAPTPPKRRDRAPEAQPEAGASWLAYALGGVGLVGVGGAGLFTYWGRQDNSTLRSSCAPDCNPASVHHVRMMYLAADLSGAAGVVALAASTWMFLHARTPDEKSSHQLARLRMLDVRPTASGTFATVGGTF